MVLAIALASLSAAAEPLEEVRPDGASGRRTYKKPEPVSFVRIEKDSNQEPAKLQVATVRYVPTDGSKLSVTLYSAVHVGDAAFYENLNRSFTRHDALLYELANDPEVLREENRDAPSIFSMLQMDMGGMLGLSDQLKAIDYNRPNFVHADIPVEELVQHAQAEGEDLLTVTAQTLLDFQRMINRGDDPMAAMGGNGEDPSAAMDPLASLFGSGGDPRQLKRELAEQLVGQTRDGILEGITVLNRYLISARNKRCLEVLDEQIAKGKTDLGIFYGAGHNPDLHRRLMADYGLKPVETTWVDAWDLNASVKPRASKADELSDEELLMHLMRRLLQSDR
jgi:hypothetical protein